jgi:DNA-binding MarR family transcriptional regulator
MDATWSSSRSAVVKSQATARSRNMPHTGDTMNAIAETVPEQQAALHAFRMIMRAVRRHYQVMERHTGISGAQTWALSLIADQPDMTVSGLASAMGTHQSTASNLVDKLVQCGLIERVKANADLRVTNLRVTVSGQEKLDASSGPVSSLLPDAITRLQPPQLQRLNQSLGDLLGMLSELEAEAAQMPIAAVARA